MQNNELETLGRYVNGVVVLKGDESVLEKFASIGFCTLGFTTKTPDGIPRETARLTNEGVRQIRREKIYRSPIKRVLYYLLNTIS